MKRLFASTSVLLALLSLDSFAEPKLEDCKKEHWEGWCSKDPTTPDTDPAPESARSVKCLRVSIRAFREVLDSRKMGIGSLASSSTDVNSTETSTGINNAQVAATAYGRCIMGADKLIQYFDAYEQNRESARTFCTENKQGDVPKVAKAKMKNFENAVQLHFKVYTTQIPSYAKTAGITGKEFEDFRFDMIPKSTTSNFEANLTNTLSTLSRDCQRGLDSARELIKIARSKAVAVKKVSVLSSENQRPIMIAQNTPPSAPSDAYTNPPSNTGNIYTRPSPSATTPSTNPPAVGATLKAQCNSLPTRGTLTPAQAGLKSQCLQRGLSVGPPR